jgi:hypothetical protein
MTRRFYHLFFCVSFLLLLLASSCEKFSGDQTIPAYLSVDSIYLTTSYEAQGTNSHKITDAWVEIDDELIGAFELPARFPVLKSGKHNVKIYPGIKKNGISTTRCNYSFYSPNSRDVTLTPDSTTKIGVLKTTYQSTTLFPWKEDFDQAGLLLDTVNGSSAYIQRTETGSSLTFEGNHSGLIALDSLHDYFEAQSHDKYSIPNAPVFLEMNFNTSNTLVIGVISYGSASLYETPIMTLNTTGGAWKKIYIDLTTTLNAYTAMSAFRVYIRALKNGGLEQSAIYLDNLKLVTR